MEILVFPRIVRKLGKLCRASFFSSKVTELVTNMLALLFALRVCFEAFGFDTFLVPFLGFEIHFFHNVGWLRSRLRPVL